MEEARLRASDRARLDGGSGLLEGQVRRPRSECPQKCVARVRELSANADPRVVRRRPQRPSEADRVTELLGDEREPLDADLLQSAEQVAAEVGRDDRVEQLVGGDEKWRLQRTQARDAFG